MWGGPQTESVYQLMQHSEEGEVRTCESMPQLLNQLTPSVLFLLNGVVAWDFRASIHSTKKLAGASESGIKTLPEAVNQKIISNSA